MIHHRTSRREEPRDRLGRVEGAAPADSDDDLNAAWPMLAHRVIDDARRRLCANLESMHLEPMRAKRLVQGSAVQRPPQRASTRHEQDPTPVAGGEIG